MWEKSPGSYRTKQGPNNKSILVGDASAIGETLQKVEEAGFAEVILYFNVGLKPHERVKDEMQRFMEEVAPGFAGGRLAAE